MSFLRVNGFPIPVSAKSGDEKHDRGGDFTRTYSGSMFSDERYDKRIWSGQTNQLTESEAMAIQGAVNGAGHVFPFDGDLYSSKGLAPVSGTAAYLTQSTAADGSDFVNSDGVADVKYGAGALSAQPASTNLFNADRRDAEGTTADYVAHDGATLTMDTSIYAEQTQSLKVVTSATINGVRGGFGVQGSGITVGGTYIGSLMIYAATSVSVRVFLDDLLTSGSATTITLTAGKWTRVVTPSFTIDPGAGACVMFVEEATADSNITFYCDMFQMEVPNSHLGVDSATWWVDGSRTADDLSYDASFLQAATSGVTVSVWTINSASNFTAAIAAMRSSSESSAIECVRFGNTYTLTRTDGDGDQRATDGAVTPDDAWHLIAFVLRRNAETGEESTEIFRNGVSISTDVYADRMPTLTAIDVLDVGHNDGADHLELKIVDDLQVLPYAATAAQILAWYNMSKAMSPLSRVYVDGDAMPDDALTVLATGRADVSRYTSGHKGGEFKDNLRFVDFMLSED